MSYPAVSAGKPFRGTPVLLTVLVSISLFGAIVAQQDTPSARTSVQGVVTARPSFSAASLLVPRPTSTPATRLLLSRDFHLWNYEATLSATGVFVDLDYIHGSMDDLDDFVEMNRESAQDLSSKTGQVDVLITLRTLLTPVVFRRWVTAKELNTQFAALRLQSDVGPRGTLTVASQPGDPLPQERITAAERQRPHIMGVYSTRATVPAERLPALFSDPAVFVVDVTPTLARLDLASQGIPDATTATVNASSPFPDMEAFGIVP